MSTCPACQREYRSGITVLLIDPVANTEERKRVCQSCASAGTTIVAVKVAVPTIEKVVKPLNADTIISQLRVLARAAKASAAFGGEDKLLYEGREQGYEGAIELVKRVVAL